MYLGLELRVLILHGLALNPSKVPFAVRQVPAGNVRPGSLLSHRLVLLMLLPSSAYIPIAVLLVLQPASPQSLPALFAAKLTHIAALSMQLLCLLLCSLGVGDPAATAAADHP